MPAGLMRMRSLRPPAGPGGVAWSSWFDGGGADAAALQKRPQVAGLLAGAGRSRLEKQRRRRDPVRPRLPPEEFGDGDAHHLFPAGEQHQRRVPFLIEIGRPPERTTITSTFSKGSWTIKKRAAAVSSGWWNATSSSTRKARRMIVRRKARMGVPVRSRRR